MKVKVLNIGVSELLMILFSRDKFERVDTQVVPEDAEIMFIGQHSNPNILRLVVQSDSFPDFDTEDMAANLPVMDGPQYRRTGANV